MPSFKKILVIGIPIILVLMGSILGINLIRMFLDNEPPQLLSVSYDPNPNVDSSMTISIFVEDVSGIRSCTFHYSENGSDWISREMRRYIILCCPPRYLIRLGPFTNLGFQVDFYFEIVDKKGNIYESDFYSFTISENDEVKAEK